jgi:hypothetical protein
VVAGPVFATVSAVAATPAAEADPSVTSTAMIKVATAQANNPWAVSRNNTSSVREAFDALSQQEKSGIGRRPLDASEITSLIAVAVNLHERALEQQKAGRWWVPIATSVFAFVGAIIGTLGGQGWVQFF